MRDVVFDEMMVMARACGRVLLAGYGEPLTSPRCLSLLRTLDAEGIEIVMSTNGVALTPRIARELTAITHLALIGVSIDSPDPAVYRDLRGGSLQRALWGLRNLMEAIDDPDRVMVTSIAMDANLHTLIRFPQLLAELGVRRLNLQALHDYNDFAAAQRLVGNEQGSGVLAELQALCAATGIELSCTQAERLRADVDDAAAARRRFYGADRWDPRYTRQCHVPWEIPFVDKDGRVFACCFAAASNARPLGRLGPQRFNEIWLGPDFERFRQEILHGRSTPEVCRKCTVAPLGAHLFAEWAATIVEASVTDDLVSISVRNDGKRSWAADDEVRIGTAMPRDSDSPLADATWLSPNRPATFREPRVQPGGRATFTFSVGTAPAGATAAFEVVADGRCWLPGTAFAVTIAGAAPPHGRSTRRRRGPLRGPRSAGPGSESRR